MSRTALVLGASGLIGGHLLDRLLDESAYDHVTTLGRRPLGRSHPKLTDAVVDFDRLAGDASRFEDVDDLFCCLGTTRKAAGSDEAFRRVDFTIPLDAARLAAERGVRQVLVVSSLGADPAASTLYLRTKGELEARLRVFPLERLQIFRPSLLTGERTEARSGEALAEKVLGVLSFALRGPLAKLKPIAAEMVAAAMVQVALGPLDGTNVFESEQIRAQAEALVPSEVQR